MARLIDADALRIAIDKLEAESDMPKMWHKGIAFAVNRIVHAPTVDAVEVVRCRDCIHKPTGSGVNHHIVFPEQDYRCPCRCEDYWYSWMPYDDWFCANGERREDETS